MPEAFAVLFVLVATVIVYVIAWLRSRDPSLVNVPEDVQRLRHHEAWLRERLVRAQLEHWDSDMVASLADELRITSVQLARLTASDGLP